MMVRHLFICGDGVCRQTWRDAFPEAKAARAVEGRTPGRLVWLLVPPGQAAAKHVAAQRRHSGDSPLVVLADVPDEEDALAALGAGASGYCNGHAAPEVLRQVATVVENGGLWVGQRLMQRLLAGTARLAPAPSGNASWRNGLTPREIEVAQAVAQGASNKEIARQFEITERTVKAHVGALLDKLGVRDRLQLSLVVNGVDTGR